MIIRSVSLALRRLQPRVFMLAKMCPAKLSYNPYSTLDNDKTSIAEYQSPNDDSEDEDNKDDLKYALSFIAWPIAFWFLYDFFFVRRNKYSHRRVTKLICRSFEAYISKKYMTNLLHTPYRKYLLKQSTEETQRVINVLKKLIAYNKLTELQNIRVMVYDIPNMFINLSADKVLIVSTKTLLLAKTDSELAFLICHAIAHFLLDHSNDTILNHYWSQSSLLELSSMQDIGEKNTESVVDDFDRLVPLNEMVCYYPMYHLLDKFEERDTDVLAHSLLKGCPGLDLFEVTLM